MRRIASNTNTQNQMKPTQLSCHQRTRGMVRAAALSVVLLLNQNINLTAQNLPPLPEPGTGQKLTPEELARLRAEAEARAKERAE